MQRSDKPGTDPPKITLLEFPHSHFCEKVRWALDYKGLAFERRSLFPGWHARTLRKMVPETTVPVLLHGGRALQGSSAIISYLDESFPDVPLMLLGREAEVLAFEKEADAEIGECIRRLLYHRLLTDAEQVSFYFMHRSPIYQRLLFRMIYPGVSRRIRGKYRIDDASAAKSQDRLERFMDRLDRVLAKQPFVFGEAFSRADIAAASLLCFLCMPKEHPVPWRPVRDPGILALMHQYSSRPSVEWVRGLYQSQRRPKSSRRDAEESK